MRGKEERERLPERYGHAAMPRPDGPMLWLHAASNGEALSTLPLIEAMKATFPGLSVLVTTGTVTAARLIEQRAPDVLHQYAPSESPAAIGRFLDHWRPDLALWIESEIWPGILGAARRRGIPLALVNGRVSERSAKRWRMLGRTIAELLRSFDLRLVQSEAVRARLVALGAPADTTRVTGDLKASRQIEAPDPVALAALEAQIGPRPCWLAASTHPGEEEAAADAHLALAKDWPDLLTLIAPRHPSRADGIETMLRARGLSVARRSRGEPVGDAEIYLADTLGEMPLCYAVAPIVFLGGGWGKLGGHNPLEPAQAGCAILSGPRVINFAETFEGLERASAVRYVDDAATLSVSVAELLRDPVAARMMASNARTAGAPDPAPLEATMAHLLPLAERAFR
jgi:3-deoxy-D-manno-octulosonic-acid transferase